MSAEKCPECVYCRDESTASVIVPAPKVYLCLCRACGERHWICERCAHNHSEDLVANWKPLGFTRRKPAELSICPEAWKAIEGVAEIGETPDGSEDSLTEEGLDI